MRDLDPDRGKQGPEVVIASNTSGRTFQISEAAAVKANSITDENSFPEFGEFLPCADSQGEKVYVEMPADMERKLAQLPGTLVGSVVRLTNRKAVDGGWIYTVEQYDDWETARADLDA